MRVIILILNQICIQDEFVLGFVYMYAALFGAQIRCFALYTKVLLWLLLSALNKWKWSRKINNCIC